MHILVGRAGDIFLGTGNYSYEDNFPTAQFAGQHSLPKEVLGAVLVNRGTALAALVSLINNVRLTLTAVRIKCAQKLRTRLFHSITCWLTKDPHPPKQLGSKFDVSALGVIKALSFLVASRGHLNWLELTRAQDSLIMKSKFPDQGCINAVSRSPSIFLLHWHANLRC